MASTTEDYESWTKADLQAEAESRGFEVSSSASKADIIALLDEADKKGIDEEHPDKSTSKELVSSKVEAADFTTGDSVQTVDIGDLSTEPLEGEHFLLTGESWVVLGEDESVPDWAVGMPAAVLSSPVAVERDDNGYELYQFTPTDAVITVRERSQGATLNVPLDSVQKVSINGGRTAVVNFP
jgi:hypothetical protein